MLGHDTTEDTRVFRDVQEVGKRLEKLQSICGSLVRPRTAVIFDQENRWALEDSCGPRIIGIHYLEAVKRHYSALWKLGIPTDVIDEGCPLNDYKLVIAPMLYLLRPGIAQRLRDFVAGGGTLLGTYHTGLVDEHDLCFEGRVPYMLTD